MRTTRLRFVENEPPKNEQERKESKKTLRAYMKQRRGDNANRDVKEILLTDNLLLALEEKGFKTGEGKKVFVYLSFSSEAPTDKLIEDLLEKGWQVYAPRVEDGKMVAVEYGEDFTLSSLGIREPLGESYDGEMDVVVVPMLAVDERGGRLGYGGGYYDRYLLKNPKGLRLAYGFDFQIVKQVPVEECDEKMDGIVTDKRIVWTSARVKE